MVRNVLPIPLTTARLTLREIEKRDAVFLVELTNDPAFIEHIGDRGLRTIADAERYVDSGPWTQYATRGFGLWLVALRDSGEPIGICGLLKRDALPDPDIGFAFSAAYRSKGLAFEAAAAVISLARHALGSPGVMAIVSRSNAASIRLLERLGFHYERMVRLSQGAPEIALYALAFDTIPPP